MVTKYFALYAGKDLDGLMSMWSASSPNREAHKKSASELFASSKEITLKSLTVRGLSVEGDKARVRVEADVQVIEAKTGKEKEGYGKLLRTLEWAHETAGWKVIKDLDTYDELASDLLAAKRDEERAALLKAETDLVKPELSSALVRSSDRLRTDKQYVAALAAAQLALKLSEQLKDRNGQALAWEMIGRVYGAQRDYQRGLENYQRALALFEELGDKQIASGVLGRIATSYYYMENYHAALETNLKRLKLKEELNDRQWIASTLDDLTSNYLSLGNYPEAHDTARRAIAIYEELNDDGGVARVLILLGSIHLEQSDYEQAIADFQKAGAIFAKNGDVIGPALATLNTGEAYSAMGDYSRALDAYQKALAVFTERKSLPRMALALSQIGELYSTLTDYDQARDYFQRSVLVSEQANRPFGRGEALNAIGNTYRRQGNYVQALHYLQQGLKLLEESGRKFGLAGALTEMGDLYLLQGDETQALEFYHRSQALFEELSSKDNIAALIARDGTLQQRRGNYAQALSAYQQSLELYKSTGNKHGIWEINSVIGKSQVALKQPDRARQSFEQAVAAIELLRSQTAGGELARRYFLEQRLAPYHSLIALLVSQGKQSDALAWAERSKARVLLDVIQSGRLDVSRAMTAAEQQQERKLRAEIISLNTQVTRNSQSDKPDQVKLADLKSLREKARLNYEAFQTSLYAEHPELRVQRGEVPVIKTEEIAELVPDAGSALLEYVVMDDATYLFAVTKGEKQAAAKVQVYTLPIKRAELAKQTESFRQQLAGRDLAFREAAKKLSDLLLRPAQSQLAGKQNLVIVPDDMLLGLPFQALVTQSNRFLIEEAALSYAPSLTVLRQMTRRRPGVQPSSGPSELLALGNPLLGKETIERARLALRDEKLDPLPEAEEEVKALGVLYGSTRSKVYVGADAREDLAKAQAGRVRVLHFATHGILNNAAPMYSHLALAQGDKNEDGLLEAWELMELNLKADLVVLSACETARGRFGAGEGMIGLTWALFVAGVPSTVVSQWQVESASTRDLMVNFHRGLSLPLRAGKDKTTKTEALRQAALKVMKNPETSHPFYWAGFVLVGDGR